MSHRNGRHPPSPRPYRGHDQFVDFNQAATEFICRFRDPRDHRYFGSPGQYIGAPLPFSESEYYDPQDYYFAGDYRPGDHGGELQAFKPTPRSPNSREDMADKGDTRQPFGMAMKKLYKELDKAEVAYEVHRASFDIDIDNIKKYATPESTVDLWDRKWTGKKGDLDGEEVSEIVECFAQTHEDLKTKLESALKEATGSKINKIPAPPRWTTIQIENAERLQSKLKTASTHIEELLRKVPTQRDYCVSLLSELVQLKGLVNPEEDGNKKLYHPGGGADVGASNGEPQEQGAGGVQWDP